MDVIRDDFTFIIQQISKLKLPPYDWVACAVCYLSRFTQMFVQGNMETIGSPYAMMMVTEAENAKNISF